MNCPATAASVRPSSRQAATLLLAALAACAALRAGSAHAVANCNVPNPPPACGGDPPPPPPPAGSPTGRLATATRVPEGVAVSGVANDPDAPGPVAVKITITGGGDAGTVWATGPGGAFAGTVPALRGSAVCATAVNRNRGTDKSLGCIPLALTLNPVGALQAVLSEAAGLRIRGWAIDQDTAAPIDVHVYINDNIARALKADVCCSVVAGYTVPPYGEAHAFQATFTVPRRGRYTLCAYGINVAAGDENTPLGCRTVTALGPPDVGIPRAIGQELSFETYPQPGRQLRVSGETLVFDAVDPMTSTDTLGFRFRKVRGLDNPGCFSYESMKYPGRFLRHDDQNRVRVQAGGLIPAPSFNGDATFCPVGLRLQSANKPGYFLRDDGNTLVLATATFGDPDFVLDSSIFEVAPLSLGLRNVGPQNRVTETQLDTERETFGACTGFGPPLTNPPDTSTLQCASTLLTDTLHTINRPEVRCAIGLPYAGFFPWVKTTERRGEPVYKVEKGQFICLF